MHWHVLGPPPLKAWFLRAPDQAGVAAADFIVTAGTVDQKENYFFFQRKDIYD